MYSIIILRLHGKRNVRLNVFVVESLGCVTGINSSIVSPLTTFRFAYFHPRKGNSLPLH